MSTICTNCGQHLTKEMAKHHTTVHCLYYRRFDKERKQEGKEVVVRTAIHILEKNNIPYTEHTIQAYREKKHGSREIKAYVADKPIGTLSNFFKGQCLQFLLWNYSVDPSFRESLKFLGAQDGGALLRFAQDTWADDGMKPLDTTVIRKAIVAASRDCEFVRFQRLLQTRKINDSEAYTEHYALTKEELEGIVNSLGTLRSAITKATHRCPEAYIAGA